MVTHPVSSSSLNISDFKNINKIIFQALKKKMVLSFKSNILFKNSSIFFFLKLLNFSCSWWRNKKKYSNYVQGLFSAIFHICPSNISLQFDTTMMNMMMILVFIKIFQLRHADTAYNAFHVMYVFAAVLVFEAVSLYVFHTTWRYRILAIINRILKV